MPAFSSGVIQFQRNVYPAKKDLFDVLSRGQSPEALFITSADARIEPALLTQTDPGDLFVCRNAGNIVPPHSSHTGGVTATIEFAVAVLNVPHIIVCGHTGCGTMQAALHPDGCESLPHVKVWLEYAQAAIDAVNEQAPDASEAERMHLLLRENVKLQLAHLKTHPSVKERLDRGDLSLHGWVYDIKSGCVDAFDEATDKFVPVADRYAEEASAFVAPELCATG